MGGPPFEPGHRSVTVSTGARLHFGLFDVRTPFGGVGMMVDGPPTIVRAEHADALQVGPLASPRIDAIAANIAGPLTPPALAGDMPKVRVWVEQAADSHCGLGSGTQLSLAAAVAIAELFSLPFEKDELVHRIAGRGRRSAIGSLGFFSGGLIFENGAAADGLLEHRRVELPSGWRVVLARPRQVGPPVSGDVEGAAFESLAGISPRERERLRDLGDQILDDAESADFEAFSNDVMTFNQLSGSLFSALQGGCYRSGAVADLVSQLQQHGAGGLGQSSWGPTVFAFCQDQSAAEQLCRCIVGANTRIVKPLADGYEVLRNPNTSCK